MNIDQIPTYDPETDTPLGAALALNEYLLECEAHTWLARQRRDSLIVEANAGGVSAYRIAKALGMAESSVGRILAKAK